MAQRTALIYFDRSADPHGWAYRITAETEESGEFAGALDEEAPLHRLLDALLADGSAPADLQDLAQFADQWRPVTHDGPGWEVRS